MLEHLAVLPYHPEKTRIEPDDTPVQEASAFVRLSLEHIHALTGQVDHGHVRNIKHARILANIIVFLDLGAIIDRHIPAGKIDQLAAVSQMLII